PVRRPPLRHLASCARPRCTPAGSTPRPAACGRASLAWMESGTSDVPDAIQALAVAALLLRRVGVTEIIPPPL
ncbi:MAG: hypothetical protein ACJ8AW_03600, partial [Rhodopila sp.]